jgi:hypothetical protein
LDEIPDEVTFLPWECELTHDTLHVMRVQYLEGNLEYGTRTGDQEFTFFNTPALASLSGYQLVITLFSLEKSSIFDVSFFNTNGFRVFDEHGLTEMWGDGEAWKKAGLGKASLFRVSGHGWTKESPLSFTMCSNYFSWMITTDWDCVEVISANEPQVTMVKAIEGVAGPVPDDPIESLFYPPTKH